ncbi:acetate non-utilizing protein 9 [Ascosphaera aggregata]|nr:acetate non-utilizing protein 9 [Ascosphaera aggregata]
MRHSFRFLAKASSLSPRGSALNPLSSALLPPLQLYRRILRTHRKMLPPEMRLLGDEYVKSEFRLHKDVENPVHIVGFLTEWQVYAQKLEGDVWRGEKIDQNLIDHMNGRRMQWLESPLRDRSLSSLLHLPGLQSLEIVNNPATGLLHYAAQPYPRFIILSQPIRTHLTPFQQAIIAAQTPTSYSFLSRTSKAQCASSSTSKPFLAIIGGSQSDIPAPKTPASRIVPFSGPARLFIQVLHIVSIPILVPDVG